MRKISKISKIKYLLIKKKLSLICPGKCGVKLTLLKNSLKCNNNKCIHSRKDYNFLIEENTPILISQENCDTLCSKDLNSKYIKRHSFSNFLRKIIYGTNTITKNNCRRFKELIKENSKNPIILVIGSGEIGNGTEKLWNDKSIHYLGVDIYENENVDIICDGHYLPFDNQMFDGVWIQAVLEHVVEPNKVVSEIFRVLKKRGIVYAETPFMQHVHEGRYDFTRFTILGHRYLFKRFEAVDFGATKGAEVVLAWSLKYFFWSLLRNKALSTFIGVFFHFVLSPFKIFMSRSSMYDSCSGSFFLGKKSNKIIKHEEIINLYKGNM